MKRNKYFEAKKQYFALSKRLEHNYQAQRNLGWIDLDKPKFSGYVKILALREDISNREDAYLFDGIIKYFGTSVYSRKKDFRYRTRKGKYEIIKPRIRNISKKEYEELIPAARKKFSICEDLDKMINGHFSYICNISSFFFIDKISRYYITKVRVIDSILIQEESELKYFLKLVRIETSYKYGYGSMTAPKFYRKHLNRRQRCRSKAAIVKFIKGAENADFAHNDKDASWYW